MTITAPDLSTDQQGPHDGSALGADPWSDGWALPSAEELATVGWPGARPPQPGISKVLEAVPDLDPATAEQLVEPDTEPLAAEQLEQTSGSEPTTPVTPDEPADETSQPTPLRSVATSVAEEIVDRDVATEPATPEPVSPGDDAETLVDLTEPRRRWGRRTKETGQRLRRSRTPKWIRQHLNSRRHLRLVTATVATAYWYFAVATLAITVVVPLVAGWTTATVMSDSMGPSISAGDVVAFAEYDGAPLDPGTIILFDNEARDGSTLTHRIVGINPDGTYETKGDANQGSDSTNVPTESIIGVARMVSPYGGLPYFWLVTGQYVWLAAWVLLTAVAAMLMAPIRDAERQGAQPVPEVETPPDQQLPIRRAATYSKSRT